MRSRVGGVTTEGVIIETEAYVGPHDPASHAAAGIGRTDRNLAMFGPPGRAYVFRSYGVHWCVNVVTREEGYPAAVLIRAADPLAGIEHMLERRGGKEPLCSGPGRLAQAFGISGDLDGCSLTHGPLVLLEGWEVPESDVRTSSRIGISKAKNWPLRFYVRGHPEISGRPR
jgi:DNA-3-methyladenine glycosylase